MLLTHKPLYPSSSLNMTNDLNEKLLAIQDALNLAEDMGMDADVLTDLFSDILHLNGLDYETYVEGL